MMVVVVDVFSKYLGLLFSVALLVIRTNWLVAVVVRTSTLFVTEFSSQLVLWSSGI